ncbi:MAG: hypothetical protein ACJAS3_003114 [Roseivirga sp.]|jgi:hypothetical protein
MMTAQISEATGWWGKWKEKMINEGHTITLYDHCVYSLVVKDCRVGSPDTNFRAYTIK